VEGRETLLVHEIAADPLGRAAEIARAVAEFSPTAVQGGMAFVQKTRGMGLQQSGEIGQAHRNEMFTTPDFKEGIRAFREKRRACWPSISGEQP
jgi:enoyl-CoA hydratase/carnithine racemase